MPGLSMPCPDGPGFPPSATFSQHNCFWCPWSLVVLLWRGPWQCQEVWSSQPRLKWLCHSKGCFPGSPSPGLHCRVSDQNLLRLWESSQFFPAEEHSPLLGLFLSATAVIFRAGQSHLLGSDSPAEGWPGTGGESFQRQSRCSLSSSLIRREMALLLSFEFELHLGSTSASS